jgi:small subunit ribosomal protein S1
LRIGQKIEVIILDVDYTSHKVSFGLKQLHEDPWEKFSLRYKPGDTISGTVLFKKPFGLIIQIVSGIEALLHISELPEYGKETNPLDFYNVDETYELKILELDKESKKLKVGIS